MGLERRLGLLSVIFISIGATLGGGIFLMPSIAFQISGTDLWLAYLLAALCALPAEFSKAELATAMPISGGTYNYIVRIFGPMVGTVAGLGLWFAMLFQGVFSLIGVYGYMQMVSQLPMKTMVICLLLAIILINLMGIKKVSAVITVIIVTTMIALFLLSGYISFEITPIIVDDQHEMMFSSVILGAATVFSAYGGVTKAAAVGGEIKNPERNLPLAFFLTQGLVALLYCTVTYFMGQVLSPETLRGDIHPVYTFAMTAGMPLLGTVVSILAILTMAANAKAGLLAGSRFPFAMSRDKLIPPVFNKLNKKLTPQNGILVSGLIMAICILFIDITPIAKFTSAFVLIISIFENAAVILVRMAKPAWYKPTFICPFFPFLPMLGIGLSVFLLTLIGKIAIYALIAVIIPSLCIYFLYGKKYTKMNGVLGMIKIFKG